MKLFTCSKLVPCIVMLHVGMTVDFENTMVKDLDPFRYNPLFSLSRTTMSISCCNSSSVSAIITVSSAYLKLLITVQPTLKPPFPSMFLMIISVYNANRCGEATQPCRMPCLMFTDSLTSPLCLTAACWFQYRLASNCMSWESMSRDESKSNSNACFTVSNALL